MSRSGGRDPRAALVRVPRALLGSSVVVLAVAGFVNHSASRAGTPDLEVVSWMAVAWCALAPIVATVVRGRGLVAPPPSPGETPSEVATRLQKTIVFFGVLDSGVVFAAAALIVSPLLSPLAAALFPLAVMALNLPSRAD